jgi:hypothetical protein
MTSITVSFKPMRKRKVGFGERRDDIHCHGISGTRRLAKVHDSPFQGYTFAVYIWSLGEITYRMIASRPAFAGPRQLHN